MVFPLSISGILVTEVLHSSLNQPSTRRNLCRDGQSGKRSNVKIKKHSNGEDPWLTKVDRVPSKAKLSDFGALFSILEDNEAVIKMIIKGRRPTMRHVSRIQNDTNFKKKVFVEEQMAKKAWRLLRERQISCMICDSFRVTGIPESILDWTGQSSRI